MILAKRSAPSSISAAAPSSADNPDLQSRCAQRARLDAHRKCLGVLIVLAFALAKPAATQAQSGSTLNGSGSQPTLDQLLHADAITPTGPRAELAAEFARGLPGDTFSAAFVAHLSELHALGTQVAVAVGPNYDVFLQIKEFEDAIGVDLSSESDFAAAGIDYDGGVVIARLTGGTVVLGVGLSDPSAFLAHATARLARTPFDLEQPVEVELGEGFEIVSFRRASDAQAALVLLIRDHRGTFILPNPDGTDPVAAAWTLGRQLQADSLASHADFITQANRFEGHMGFSFFSRPFERSVTPDGPNGPHPFVGLFSSAGLGLTLIPGVEVEYHLTLIPGMESLAAAFSPAPGPELGALQSDDTFFSLRVGLEPRTLFALAQSNPGLAEAVWGSELVGRLEGLLEVTIDGREPGTPYSPTMAASAQSDELLIDLLPTNLAVMFSNQNILSLLSASSVGEYMDALDGVVVFDLPDVDAVERHLDSAVNRELLVRLDHEANPTYVGLPGNNLGCIQLRDGYGVWVAEELADSVSDLVPGPGAAGLEGLAEVGRDFIEAPSANGVHLDLSRLDLMASTLLGAGGDLISLIDNVTFTVESVEGGFSGAFIVQPAAK